MPPIEPSTQALLDRAAERHGGWERWRRLAAITVRLESLRGPIPWLKGLGRSFPAASRVTIEPRAQRLVAHDYPTPGREMVFDRGRVDAGPDGQRERMRAQAPWTHWSPADSLYFFGYALTHYLGLPFSLADAEIVEHRHRPGEARPDRVSVRYGAGAHTHGMIERFHFDQSGLLVRHDYHAEVLGPGAHGAHWSRDYVEVDGLMIARHREVHLRIGGRSTPLVVLDAQLVPLSVAYAT